MIFNKLNNIIIISIFFLFLTSPIFSQAPPKDILFQLESALNYFESDEFNGSYRVKSDFTFSNGKEEIIDFTILLITKKTGEEAVTEILETRTTGIEADIDDDDEEIDFSTPIRVPAGTDFSYYSFGDIKYIEDRAIIKFYIKNDVKRRDKDGLGSGSITWNFINKTLEKIFFVPFKKAPGVTKSNISIEFETYNGNLYPETIISQGEVGFLFITEHFYSKLYCYDITTNYE